MEQQHIALPTKPCSLKFGVCHVLRWRLAIMFVLVMLAGSVWGFSNHIPGVAAQGADEFFVFDFYEPAGWMLNNVQLDRFAFVPTSGTECATASTCYKVIWREARFGEWLGLYWIPSSSRWKRRWGVEPARPAGMQPHRCHFYHRSGTRCRRWRGSELAGTL